MQLYGAAVAPAPYKAICLITAADFAVYAHSSPINSDHFKGGTSARRPCRGKSFPFKSVARSAAGGAIILLPVVIRWNQVWDRFVELGELFSSKPAK